MAQLVDLSLLTPTKDVRSKSSNREIVSSVNCTEKMKIKKREVGDGQILIAKRLRMNN